jgi:predicted kinase
MVRKELFGQHQHDTAVDEGIYSPESRERVYQVVFRRAGKLQHEGVSVVLDGTFATPSAIAHAGQAAIRPHAFLAIQCVCRPEVACERIARRRLVGSDASDAQVETYHLQSSRWEDWEPTMPQVRIDTEQTLEMQLRQTIEAIAGSVQLCVDKTPG